MTGKEIKQIMIEMTENGATQGDIAEELNRIGARTPNDGVWCQSRVSAWSKKWKIKAGKATGPRAKKVKARKTKPAAKPKVNTKVKDKLELIELILSSNVGTEEAKLEYVRNLASL